MSETPSDTSPDEPVAPSLPAPPWRANLILFVATLTSVFITGIAQADKDAGSVLVQGAQFAGTIMTILVAHELGHYVTARFHRVDASLPFFIPMPMLSPFGTMGAVIRMRGEIPTRRALLDIGASGPLAGLVFALPLYAWGAAHSTLVPMGGENMAELGESILLKGLDRAFGPATPDGMELMLSPVAFGAWGGMFVTMINLLPVGQLDGGHVAYSLFGPRQDRFAITIHRAMLVFFGVIVIGHLGRDVSAGRAITVALLSRHVANAVFWLVWFQVLAVLGLLASRGRERAEGEEAGLSAPTRIIATIGLVGLAAYGRQHPSIFYLGGFFAGLAVLLAMEVKGGVLRDHQLLVHPPTAAEPLGRGRKLIAAFTLLLFALLFMPEPFSL